MSDRSSLRELIVDYDLDPMKTEGYLLNLGRLSYETLEYFERALIYIPKESCRSNYIREETLKYKKIL